MSRAVLAAALFLSAAPVESIAEEGGKDLAEKLHTRVLQVGPSMLREEKLPVLPRTPSGEERFDATAYLKENGLRFAGPEMKGIWLPARGALVVTAKLEDQQQVERMFEISCGVEINTYQYTISVWEFQAPADADAKQPYLLETLKQLAGGTARLIHTNTVQARSGNAVAGSSGAGRVKEPAIVKSSAGTEEKTDLNGTRGSSIYIEAVQGFDRRMVNMSLEYSVRVPFGQANQDFEMKGKVSLDILEGNDVVVQIAQPPLLADPPDPNNKKTRYAVVMRADLRPERKAFFEELEAQNKKEILAELLWEKEVLEKAKGK
jgi:hypothetical protein